MQFRFLLNLVIFFLLTDNITNAQEVGSFEIIGYPELNEIMADQAPSSSPSSFVGKIKLHTKLIIITNLNFPGIARTIIFMTIAILTASCHPIQINQPATPGTFIEKTQT